ncbi:MAG: FtsX-like permease family protein [Rhizobiales bacterium]|nr:FtsX-like permease family protein [Hyphomicrobiales bacterium]
MSEFSTNSLAYKWAKRETLSNFKNGGFWGGVRGFGIFLTAIFLGVFAIALVGSFSASLNSGLNGSGQVLLGGDVDLRITNQFADDKLLDHLKSRGQISQVTHFRGMARSIVDQDNAILVDAKSIDNQYPLVSSLDIENNGNVEKLSPSQAAAGLAKKDNKFGLYVDQALLFRLNISANDDLKFGEQIFEIRGVIKSEPDRISAPFTFGPRIILSREAMLQSGLIETGSIFDEYHKLLLNDKSEKAIETFNKELKQNFPLLAVKVQDKTNAAPNLKTMTTRLTIFLTLISLTILVVGGVGIANSVKLYVESKRTSIATFKSLGATDGLIFRLYGLQILAITVLGVVAGIILGAAIPFLTISVLHGLLPLPLDANIFVMPLLDAAIFGFLVSALFSLIPLAAIYNISPRSLYRSHIESSSTHFTYKFIIPILVILALLVWRALALADYSPIATQFVGAIFVIFFILRFLGFVINYIMRKLPRSKRPELRLAISNMARPQSPLTTIIISLGLGLTLLVTISMVEGNIAKQLNEELPDRAPAFFLIDIKKDEVKPLNALLNGMNSVEKIETVPLMRGKITQIRGIEVSKIKIPEGQNWVTRGSRGLTYSETLPDNSTLSAGKWWANDYEGEPLVSITDGIGEAFGLKIGDTITISLFSREITAKIASFRKVNWQGLSINFVMVFSPNTLRDAPHVHMATITLKPTSTIEDEAEIQKQLVKNFPTVTTIAMRNALEVAYNLTSQLTLVIRLAGGLTLITGFLVLGGAIAAGNRARTYDMVILKALGTSRKRLLSVLIAEFAILGIVASIIALILGGIAASAVLDLMNIPSTFMWDRAIITLVLGTLSVLLLGLFGTYRILGKKAAQYLQSA